MLCVELCKEFRGIFDVLFRIEHFGNTGEMVAVITMIDLHAAEVDECGSLPFCLVENLDCLFGGVREISLAFDVQRPGLERSLAARLGEADRIEDTLGNLVFAGRGRNLAFADTGRCLGVKGRDCQCR